MSRNIPEVSATNKILVNAKIAQLENKCYDVFGFRLNPTIDYNLSGRIAGTAKISENKITLNSYLLAENKDNFINDTVVHEYIHLVQYKVYKSTRINKVKPHGHEFYLVAEKMKVNVNRCHSFETIPGRKTTKYSYPLNCGCNIKVGKKIHDRIQCFKNANNFNGELLAVCSCKLHKTKIYAKDFKEIVKM